MCFGEEASLSTTSVPSVGGQSHRRPLMSKDSVNSGSIPNSRGGDFTRGPSCRGMRTLRTRSPQRGQPRKSCYVAVVHCKALFSCACYRSWGSISDLLSVAFMSRLACFTPVVGLMNAITTRARATPAR